MNNSKPTPRPWRYQAEVEVEPLSGRIPITRWAIYYSKPMGPDFIVGEASKEANAEYIVRAVNSHAALVEALKGAQSVIEEYRRAFDDYGLFLGDDNKRFDTTIRAALELAGKSDDH